jgi:hypothetical protein
MPTSLIIQGQLHSPYFIFVRRPHEFADADLLTRFGLHNYERTKSVAQLGRYAILADAGTWTLLADDWHYTLWHMPTTGSTIEDLAATHDVFACSVGDIDRSFDFVYYRNAALVRKYAVSDPHMKGRKMVNNIGEPLPAETEVVTGEYDEISIVLRLAESIGIKTEYQEAELRIYVAPRTN